MIFSKRYLHAARGRQCGAHLAAVSADASWSWLWIKCKWKGRPTVKRVKFVNFCKHIWQTFGQTFSQTFSTSRQNKSNISSISFCDCNGAKMRKSYRYQNMLQTEYLITSNGKSVSLQPRTCPRKRVTRVLHRTLPDSSLTAIWYRIDRDGSRAWNMKDNRT